MAHPSWVRNFVMKEFKRKRRRKHAFDHEKKLRFKKKGKKTQSQPKYETMILTTPSTKKESKLLDLTFFFSYKFPPLYLTVISVGGRFSCGPVGSD